jgi:DNA primase
MTHLDLETIKRGHSLAAVARQAGIKLIRNGAEWKALCPFHGEKTPSFYLYGERFHCNGCGAHGDVIDLMSRLKGCGWRDAVSLLATGNYQIDDRPAPTLSPDQRVNRIAEARDVWNAARPIAGTPAEA